MMTGTHFERCFLSTCGRVWVHHLSLSSGHHRNSNGQWLSCSIPWSIKIPNSVYPEFIMIHSFAFIYKCQQTKRTGSATTGTSMCDGLNSSSGGELKLYLGCTGSTLRWGTQNSTLAVQDPRSGGELKLYLGCTESMLRWWTQTLPRLYRTQAQVVNLNSTSAVQDSSSGGELKLYLSCTGSTKEPTKTWWDENQGNPLNLAQVWEARLD